jgi:hypothetical protein
MLSRRNPDVGIRIPKDRITEVDAERLGFLRLAAKDRMTESELDEALAELKGIRELAQKELETLQ